MSGWPGSCQNRRTFYFGYWKITDSVRKQRTDDWNKQFLISLVVSRLSSLTVMHYVSAVASRGGVDCTGWHSQRWWHHDDKMNEYWIVWYLPLMKSQTVNITRWRMIECAHLIQIPWSRRFLKAVEINLEEAKDFATFTSWQALLTKTLKNLCQQVH